MKQCATATVAALLLASGFGAGAQAAQFATIDGIGVADYGRVDPSIADMMQPRLYATNPPVGAFVDIMVGQPGGANPFAPNPGWAPFGLSDTTHHWVNIGDSNTAAFYALSGNSLTIVWGSPNDNAPGSDNVVSFLDGMGGVIGSVEAADLYSSFTGISNTQDPGYVIKFTVPEAFSGVKFSTGPSAFEWALTSNIPEPPTWAMMLLGFSGLGYAAFRRDGRKANIG